MEKGFFLERKTRLNRLLRRNLGLLSSPFEVRPLGRRPNTSFSLDQATERIRFAPISPEDLSL
jgi:hypothetical protein